MVFDKTTREPLPYCNISLLNTARGTTTNNSGEYLIKVDRSDIAIKYRYIGYQSQTVGLDLKANTTNLNVYLEKAIIPSDTVKIIGYKNTEAERLILKASKRKERSRRMLKNYSCFSYTKSSYRSIKKMETFAGILEAFSEIHYQYPDAYREVVRSQRQSANIPRSVNYLTGDTFLDVNADRFTMGNKQIIGPTASDAVGFYHFEILDTLYEDQARLIRIEFKPKNENLPLMEGRLILSDQTCLIKTIEARFNRACDYDFFKAIGFIQRYQSFSDSIYLPFYSRSESRFEIGIPGYPPFLVSKESWRENFKVNVPQQTADNPEEEQVSIRNEYPFSEVPMLIPPLTAEEQKGYARIDSLVGDNKILFAVTQMLKWMDVYESIREMPVGSFSDFFRFNRVEGTFLGLSVDTEGKTSPFSAAAGAGYGFGDERAKYFMTPQWNQAIGAWRASVLYSNYHSLNARETYDYYPAWMNTFSALFSGHDLFDYYYAKGNKITFAATKADLKVSAAFFREKHEQAFKNVTKSPLGGPFRDQIEISEGRLRGYTVGMQFSNAAYRESPLFRKFKPHQRYLEIEVFYERGMSEWGGDFGYTKWGLASRWRQNLFQQVLADVIFNLGSSSRATPVQKWYSVAAGDAWYDQFRTFSTLKPNQLTGRARYELFTEINFTDLLYPGFLKKRLRYELSLICNNAWAGSSFDMDAVKNESYSEVGFGVDKIFGIIKLEFVWGLARGGEKHPFSFNVRMDDFDIF